MKNKLYIILCFGLIFQYSIAQTSQLVYPGKDGKLVYAPYTEQGDLIPDFSFCGYKGGGVSFPNVPVAITLEPGDFTTDDSPRIQAAIDQLSQKKPDKNNIRGAILFKKGKYRIDNTLWIKHSGIVLRGEGENATVFIATKRKQYVGIRIGYSISPDRNKGTEQPITDNYVPSGTKKITVKDASGFKVGDNIIVERPSTKEWISFLKMDKLAPRWRPISELSPKELEKYKKEGKLSEDGKKYDSTEQWAPGSKNLRFERVITAINGNEITLNIPLVNAFQQEYGGGSICHYSFREERPSEIGLEHFSIVSEFNDKITKQNNFGETYCADEDHMETAVDFRACENIWVRNVTLKHIVHYGFRVSMWCKYITIQDCKVLDPVSIITGKRRYCYNLGGQMGLVQRCYSSKGRHDFVQGASVPGPNAFVDSKAEYSYAGSEPHHRWSAGCLFDNCDVSGLGGFINFANRGNSGTGHGWAGAQMVAWNCKAPMIVVMRPPTAQNFCIGGYPLTDKEGIEKVKTLSEKKYGPDHDYKGGAAYGDGYIEHSETLVKPQYLYYKQLWDRLGKEAVMRVTTPEQQRKIFQK